MVVAPEGCSRRTSSARRAGMGGTGLDERAGHRARSRRRVLIDLTPLNRSRDLRCLVLGELISVLGTQLTTVATRRKS
jgi:hypothetical protein